jgi:small subunit ribosomal protein S17
LQYFNKEAQLWAADPNLKYDVGDLVIVKKLPEAQSADVRHYVAEPVFHIGNVIDPVTGRRCRGPEYIDETNRSFNKLGLVESQPASSKSRSRKKS